MLLKPDQYASLRKTFDHACAHHPELMERYICMWPDCVDDDDKTRLMWRGLRETIKRRYPS